MNDIHSIFLKDHAMSIVVQDLRKEFAVKRRVPGRFLLSRTEMDSVSAVKGVSFDIRAGERVAFIGPNGAGKSTTLKMLSGILYPTSGHATVAGLVPWENRQKLAYHIGLVFGQRSQLWYHLPVRQSFSLLGKIYGLDDAAYTKQLAALTTTFDLSGLLDRPVRSLSLGQRMRCEVAASLLHAPDILFLDEPTIGLDVTTKAELRDHLKAISIQHGTTILLTSHDTADIEEVCDRVILINHGEKLIDTALTQMRKTYLRQKQITFATTEEHPTLPVMAGVSALTAPYHLTLDVDLEQTTIPQVIAHAMQHIGVHDMTVTDQALEEVIKRIYKAGR